MRSARRAIYRVERSSGSFARSLTLPEGVDADAVAGETSNAAAALEVRIPKPEARKPQKVAISVGGGEPTAIEGSESGLASP